MEAARGLSDIDQRDRFGRTLLMYASIYRREKLVLWLLEKGADPYARDAEGCTIQQLVTFYTKK